MRQTVLPFRVPQLRPKPAVKKIVYTQTTLNEYFVLSTTTSKQKTTLQVLRRSTAEEQNQSERFSFWTYSDTVEI